MSKIVTSAKGKLVDFDLLKIQTGNDNMVVPTTGNSPMAKLERKQKTVTTKKKAV